MEPVILTQNERFQARRFGDNCYLYVALDVAIDSELDVIQNSGAQLEPEKVVEVRYRVGAEEILSRTRGEA
ncbi:MAG: hypothetical protein Kow0047_31690 [Anaerolineae bacterium]